MMEVDAILAAADSDSDSDLNVGEHSLRIEDILNETTSDDDDNRLESAIEFENVKADALKSTFQHIDSTYSINPHEVGGSAIPSSPLTFLEGLEPTPNVDINIGFSSDELERIIHSVDLENTESEYGRRYDRYTLSSPLPRHDEEGRGATAHRTPLSLLGCIPRSFDSSPLSFSKYESSEPLSSPVSKVESFELKSFREDQRLVVNPLEVKRRMRLSKGQGTHQVRGGAVRIETLHQGKKLTKSKYLNTSIYNEYTVPILGQISDTISSKGGVQSRKITSQPRTANNNSHGPGLGSATCIAVHSKFVVIGTSLGALMLFDHFQELRHILGPCNYPNPKVRFDSITRIVMFESLKGSATEDFLVSGSASGCINLWDYIKGTVLRVVDDVHSAPIMSIQCLRGYPAVVTSDSKGMVNKISFRRVMWSAWIADVLCLLDGTAGFIQSLSVLSCSFGCLKSTGASLVTDKAATSSTTLKSAVKGLSSKLSNTSNASSFPDVSVNNNAALVAQPQSGDSTTSIRSTPSASIIAAASRRGSACEHLLAMCSKKSTFIVAMQPTVKVIFKWPHPIAANGEMTLKSQAHVVWSHEIEKNGPRRGEVDKPVPSLFDDSHAILIRTWGCTIQTVKFSRGNNYSCVPTFKRCHNITVGDPVLAIECINQKVIAYLSESMYVHIRYMDAEMSELHKIFVGQCNLVSHPISSSSLHPNVDYTGSFRACDQLYLLGSDSLTTISITSWKQRANTLVAAGEWLEALTVSLDHFQNVPEPYNNRDLAFATTLLLRYVKLAIENAPHGSSSSSRKLPQALDLANNHFEMLAGVCIEYSAITQQLDSLFNEMFSQFVAAGQRDIFLTTLGPYIMTGRVKWLPVDALLSLTQFHEERNSMRTVEHCIMSLDKMGKREGQELDIGVVLDVLQRHHLWAGLLNVCSTGLSDYLSAFEALLQLLMEKADLAHSKFENTEYSEDTITPLSPQHGLSSPPHVVEYPRDHEFEYLGYLLLLYLRHCIQGKGFLFGDIPSEILPRVRAQLLYLLCQRVSCASGIGNIKLENVHHLNGLGISNTIWRASIYPYLQILLYMDLEATLKVISSVLEMPDAKFNDDKSITSDLDEPNIYEDQEMLAAVAVDMGLTKCPGRCCILMAVTSALMPEIAGEGKHMTHILPNCRDGSPWPQSCKPSLFEFLSKYLELSLVQLPDQVVNAVLKYILTKRSNEPNAQSQLLSILQHVPIATINSDALLPLMVEARFFRAVVFLLRSSPVSPTKFADIVTYYLQDTTPGFGQQIFSLIREEAHHITALGGDILGTIGPILARLVEIDTSSCVKLICDMGWSHDWVLENLDAHSRLKFQYLDVLFRQAKELVQGDYRPEFSEDTGDLVDGFSSSSEALSEHQQSQYIELLIQFEPQLVFTYLSTSDGYNLDKCLDLCQTHGILDATAYLLEKHGDIAGAMDLSISSIDEKILRLKVALHSLNIEALVAKKKMRQASLHVPSAMFSCTPEGRDLSHSVDFVIDLCRNHKRGGNDDSRASLWLAALDKFISLKKITVGESYKSVQIVVGILDTLIQRLVDAMSVELPLHDILTTLLTRHSEQCLGEFRELCIGILDSAVYERTIYRVATSLLFNDVVSFACRRHCLIRGGVHARLEVEDRVHLGRGGATIGSTGNDRVTIDVVDKSHDVLIQRRLDNEGERRALSNQRVRQTVENVGISGCKNLAAPSLRKESKCHIAQYSQTSMTGGGWLSAGISVGGAWSDEARKGIVSAVPRLMGTLREERKQSK